MGSGGEKQKKMQINFKGGTKSPSGFFSVTSPTREEVRGMVAGSEAL